MQLPLSCSGKYTLNFANGLEFFYYSWVYLFRTIEEYSPTSAGNSTIDAMALLTSTGNFLGTFVGSISVGALAGCFAALLTKFTKIRDFPLLETSLFVCISYMSFLTAEASGMTGMAPFQKIFVGLALQDSLCDFLVA